MNVIKKWMLGMDGIVAIVFAILVVSSQNIFGSGSSETAKKVTLTKDYDSTEYITEKITVSQFLKSINYTLDKHDLIQVSIDAKIEDDMEIVIERGIPFTSSLDGTKTNEIVKNGTSIKEYIKTLEKEGKGKFLYVKGDSNKNIFSDMELELVSRTEKTITKKEVAPFETEIIETEDLAYGTEEVVTEGVDGTKNVTYKIVYYGKEEHLKKVVEEEILEEPINKVIRKGVGKSVKTPKGKLKYSKHLKMTATAYTAGFESTGKNPGDWGYGITASGMKARVGVVAVDPRVIPLGTKLYIPGYGEAIAGDTGGAIKGHKIDLFYETVPEALSFGRRGVDVYVLK